MNSQTTADNAPNFDPVLLARPAAHVIPTCAMKVQRKTNGGSPQPLRAHSTRAAAPSRRRRPEHSVGMPGVHR